MLPGEADAAEDLDAVLGVVHRVVQRQRGGGRGGERVLAGCLVGGAGGVPGQGGGAFGPAGHGGAQVLDRLERADRAAELAADPGVAGRRARCTRRPPRRLRRRTGWRPGRGRRAFQAGAGGLAGGDDRVGEPDGGQLAGEVDRRRAGDGDARAARRRAEPRLAVGRGAPQEQVRGRPRPRTGPVSAGHPQRAVGCAGPGQRAGVEGDGRGGLARRQGGEFSGDPARGEQQAGQRGGQDRPGTSAMASCSRAAARSVTVPPLPAAGSRSRDAEGGQVVQLGSPPARGQPGPGSRATHRRDRAGLLGPVAERRLQGLLLLRHRDRHGLLLPSV